MDISPKHRILLLAVSVAILGLALFWWGRVEEQDPNRPLVELLEARGYQVLMIRTQNDVNISNSERAQMANNAPACL